MENNPLSLDGTFAQRLVCEVLDMDRQVLCSMRRFAVGSMWFRACFALVGGAARRARPMRAYARAGASASLRALTML